MTSIVHLPDFHAAPGPRNPDRYRALDQIIEESLVLPGLGAFVWPGDLFDATSHAEDRNALDERIQRMANAAPVIVCYGNHDGKGDLDGFANLRATHPIYVIDRPYVLNVRLATGEMAAIFCLPYPHKAGLVSANIAPGDVSATGGDLLEPIFMQAAADLEACRRAGQLTLMIGHVNVAGAQMSSGQPSVGREIDISAKHLDLLGDIPKLLNHVHRPQTIAGAHYAGSVCRLDYGETEAKRYLVVEFGMACDQCGARAVDGVTRCPSLPYGSCDGTMHIAYDVTSHPIDVAPMYHFAGELTPVGFLPDLDPALLCPSCDGSGEDVEGDAANGFTRGPCADCEGSGRRVDWAGADIRVRYRYRASDRAVISDQGIRDAFAGALRLKVEGVLQADREIRAPAVAAATTLADKVAAFRGESTLLPSVAAKLAALERGDHTAILQEVAADLKVLESRPPDVPEFADA